MLPTPQNLDQRQTCKVCFRPDKFNFDVPDEIWAAVVPPEFRNRVVCLYCFDDFALSKGISYAESLDTLYFAGDRATFTFRVVSAVNVSTP